MEEKLNPGIIKVVKLLNSAGFATCDSGDGKTHEHACDRPDRYVVVKLPLSADPRLAANEVYELLMHSISDERFGHIIINANYDPRDARTYIDICPITDDDLL